MRHDGAELTMSGRAATNPSISGSNAERVTFRAVSTERRYDESAGDWVDGDEFGVAVVCWKQLGVSVLALVRKGDPVVVTGRMTTRRYQKDGVTDYFTECKADHVAIDVGRAAGRVRRQELSATHDPSVGAGTPDGSIGAGGASGRPVAAEPAEPEDPFQVGVEATRRELVEVV